MKKACSSFDHAKIPSRALFVMIRFVRTVSILATTCPMNISSSLRNWFTFKNTNFYNSSFTLVLEFSNVRKAMVIDVLRNNY